MKEQSVFMKEAIDLARNNVQANNGGPFGAVVVKDGIVIGRGVNMVTTNNDPTAHAEIVAIREACKNLDTFSLEGCQIYTSCEPCPMCLGSIYWAGLEKLYYAATRDDATRVNFKDARIYKELALPAAKRQIPAKQLMHKEAVKVLKDWSLSKHKIPY